MRARNWTSGPGRSLRRGGTRTGITGLGIPSEAKRILKPSTLEREVGMVRCVTCAAVLVAAWVTWAGRAHCEDAYPVQFRAADPLGRWHVERVLATRPGEADRVLLKYTNGRVVRIDAFVGRDESGDCLVTLEAEKLVVRKTGADSPYLLEDESGAEDPEEARGPWVCGFDESGERLCYGRAGKAGADVVVLDLKTLERTTLSTPTRMQLLGLTASGRTGWVLACMSARCRGEGEVWGLGRGSPATAFDALRCISWFERGHTEVTIAGAKYDDTALLPLPNLRGIVGDCRVVEDEGGGLRVIDATGATRLEVPADAKAQLVEALADPYRLLTYERSGENAGWIVIRGENLERRLLHGTYTPEGRHRRLVWGKHSDWRWIIGNRELYDNIFVNLRTCTFREAPGMLIAGSLGRMALVRGESVVLLDLESGQLHKVEGMSVDPAAGRVIALGAWLTIDGELLDIRSPGHLTTVPGFAVAVSADGAVLVGESKEGRLWGPLTWWRPGDR